MLQSLKALFSVISADFIGTPATPSGFVNPSDAPTRIASIFNMFLIIACVAATIYVTYAGLLYILSSGDPGKIKQAQSTWQFAMLGLIVSYAAFAILHIVGGMIGIRNYDLPL